MDFTDSKTSMGIFGLFYTGETLQQDARRKYVKSLLMKEGYVFGDRNSGSIKNDPISIEIDEKDYPVVYPDILEAIADDECVIKLFTKCNKCKLVALTYGSDYCENCDPVKIMAKIDDIMIAMKDRDTKLSEWIKTQKNDVNLLCKCFNTFQITIEVAQNNIKKTVPSTKHGVLVAEIVHKGNTEIHTVAINFDHIFDNITKAADKMTITEEENVNATKFNKSNDMSALFKLCDGIHTRIIKAHDYIRSVIFHAQKPDVAAIVKDITTLYTKLTATVFDVETKSEDGKNDEGNVKTESGGESITQEIDEEKSESDSSQSGPTDIERAAQRGIKRSKFHAQKRDGKNDEGDVKTGSESEATTQEIDEEKSESDSDSSQSGPTDIERAQRGIKRSNADVNQATTGEYNANKSRKTE
ncbi:MAG: hypothetical protein Faunusvirus10_23 [Faunusvirus sp.]|jgi:hypothetical protein|uniref:Uncharacterized protein n=1 Tax=Faunusvirus sp. TaxID=2487766 RepID=A0A3G4ZWZ0_9VIRU|nr:MAG: hypothetical protein Faunusvirus10_23 [Faunusvirus sp.]